MIDANIFPALISILQTAEFRTRKEAAWAITNATSGGSIFQPRLPVSVQTPQNEMSIFSEVLNQNYTLYS